MQKHGLTYRVPLAERFYSYVDIDDVEKCWPWKGHVAKDGYGNFWNPGGSKMAHRVSYEINIGPIPVGLTLDHVKEKCSRRDCVNPYHLEPVTSAENTKRGMRANLTHCKHGHEFNEKNTIRYLTPRGGPGRGCRKCACIRQMAHYYRRRAEECKSMV